MARAKTTPASTAGSFAPCANPRSRVEPDLTETGTDGREQARIDRLWNGLVSPNEYRSTGAWPYTKAGLVEMRAELALMGAPAFAVRYDVDLIFDPAGKATPDEIAAYCNRWLDDLEATKAFDQRANRLVLDVLRGREEPAERSIEETQPEYTVVHTIDLGDDRTVEVASVGDGYKVTRFDDGIGFEYGGDIFGIDGTIFATQAEALAAATKWAGRGGGE